PFFVFPFIFFFYKSLFFFAHDLNNLETLCIKCHNKKEKRFIKKENKWKDEKW
ncbi:HNH endonuclease, partial [Staphylococcus aureus]|uniref:HNH endonuclease n=1 Tax=Staphylococcus aureus TaxID=1280 RepID=UPI00168A4CD0